MCSFILEEYFTLRFNQMLSLTRSSAPCSCAWVRGLPGLIWAHMIVGHANSRKERLKGRIKWRRKLEDVLVQGNVPGDPQPETEGVQDSGWRPGWGPGSRPRTGEACRKDFYGDGNATLPSSDAVDSKQTQRCGGAQAAGGVPQLPLAVAAWHGEESDRHGLQVTLPVCLCERKSCSVMLTD